jgi:hypothetical protein
VMTGPIMSVTTDGGRLTPLQTLTTCASALVVPKPDDNKVVETAKDTTKDADPRTIFIPSAGQGRRICF